MRFEKFQGLRYAETNEDLKLVATLLDVKEGNNIIGIAGSGDALFTALAENPSTITGIDLNRYQVAYCELRKSAFRTLTGDEYCAFFGFEECGERDEILQILLRDIPQAYHRLIRELSSEISLGIVKRSKFYLEMQREYQEFIDILKQLGIDREIAVGLKGDEDQRQRIVAQIDEVKGFIRFSPKFRDYFRGFIRKGIINNPLTVVHELGTYTPDTKPTFLNPVTYVQIKSHIDAIDFQVSTLTDLFEQPLEKRPDRVYKSNSIDYLTEQELLELKVNISQTANHDCLVFYFSRHDLPTNGFYEQVTTVDVNLDRTSTMKHIYLARVK